MKSVLIFDESYFHSSLYPASEMTGALKKAELHAKFQFDGLRAVIQPDLNKVEKCEKRMFWGGFFCRLLQFFNVVQISLLLRLILPSLGLDEKWRPNSVKV
jgi:hypothetical protein